jgi:hypothetical protein
MYEGGGRGGTRPGKPGSVIPDFDEGLGYRVENCMKILRIYLGMDCILNLEGDELYSN